MLARGGGDFNASQHAGDFLDALGAAQRRNPAEDAARVVFPAHLELLVRARRHLRQILGLDRRLRVAIVGAGNLGLALADYPGFRQEGFEIAALFDTLREKVGQTSRGGVPIHDIQDLRKIAKRDGIRIAVIAVPAQAAQAVLDQVVAAGIKAVLNFSPGTLEVPSDVKLKGVDLTVSLESLSFFIAQDEHG